MIKVETLQAFISVTNFGSFTAAAEYHQQTAMAISKQVSSLEKQLGEALFVRTTRQVNLTEFGEQFLQKAQVIMAEHHQLDEWLDKRENDVSGHLSICAQNGEMFTETIFPWLGEFCQHYPNLTLSFDIQEGIIDIHRHKHDVYWGVSEYLGDKFPGLKKRALWRSTYGIYASPSYIQQHGLPKTIDDLTDHEVIGYLHNQPNNILVFKNEASSVTNPFQHKLMSSRIQSSTGLAELAKQGLGIINAAADEVEIRKAIAQGKLVPLLENHWSDMAEVFIYFQQTKVQQLKVRAFIDFFIEKREVWSTPLRS